VLSNSSGARSKGGRLFQVAGPNTAKLCWPVEVRTLGKRRVPVEKGSSRCRAQLVVHCHQLVLTAKLSARTDLVSWQKFHLVVRYDHHTKLTASSDSEPERHLSSPAAPCHTRSGHW